MSTMASYLYGTIMPALGCTDITGLRSRLGAMLQEVADYMGLPVKPLPAINFYESEKLYAYYSFWPPPATPFIFIGGFRDAPDLWDGIYHEMSHHMMVGTTLDDGSGTFLKMRGSGEAYASLVAETLCKRRRQDK